MGLFDGWQFDPGSYAPQQSGQGLLDALLRQAAGPASPQYDTMGNSTGAMQTQFQPSYVPPNAAQPLAPLPAPINVASLPVQNPGMMPPSQQQPAVDPAALPTNAQPAQYQAQAAAPGFGDRLFAGLQSFGQGGREGGLIGALTGGAEGFSTGATRQNMTEQALVKAGYDPAIAKTIVKDRGLLAAVLPSLTGANLKPTYGVIGKDQFGNEQYGWIDPRKQTVTPGNAGGGTVGEAPAGKVMGPDGKLIDIPPGADPKEFRRKMTDATADALSGKKTEVQQKADQFAGRMELAEKNIKGLESEGTGASGAWNAVAGEVPVIGATMQGEKYQKYDQAKRSFITALLRQESGAAIGKSEFDRYDKEFFPQPGNSPEIIAQKREARRVAIEAMRRGAGPGSQSVTGGGPSGVTSGGIKWGVAQ